MFTGIDKNSLNNFDIEMYERIKDKHYIIQLCDDLIELSRKIFGFINYSYCRNMLYNSVLSPWYGILPAFRFDVSQITRDTWTRTYLDAFEHGERYLNVYFNRRGIDL